jgi:hypothetical protein
VWAAVFSKGALSPRKGTSVIVFRAGIALLVCLAASSFADAAPARAVSASGAVQVLECRIYNRLSYVDPYRPVTITFVNRGDVSVDAVRFTIEYAGRTATLVDRGTFSKDVTIEHAFRAFWNVPYAGAAPQKCVVDSVHYAGDTSS